jgi:hypothetical protein
MAAMARQPSFGAFQASELYCPKCKAARPVRQHLLLVLPTGNKYEYRCSVCATPVGARDDGDPTEYQSLLRRP